MEKQKTTLLYSSYFFYGFAALDIIQIILSMINGTLRVNAHISGLSDATANTVVTVVFIILLVLSSIGTIIKLYLAFKGINQASGKGNGYGHIVWAKIVAVLLVIGVVSTITGITRGTEPWYTLVSPLLSLVAALFYIKSATALKA